METTTWIVLGIVAIAWIVFAFLAYRVIKGWGKSKFETIWYSIFWPTLLFLYPIHKYHNRKDKKEE